MICYSGGAIGSDSIFEAESIKHGVNVVAYSFVEHNTKSSNLKVLSKKQLEDGFKHIEIANKKLNRNIYNISSYVKNLISRDYYQVKSSDAIFAVGIFNGIDEVNGGTGWAVQIAIDNKKPVYVFEQNDNQWYYFDYESEKFEIFEGTPVLTDKFTGIGTRKINNNGIKAIINLFNET
jgi:hypothetical protein